MTLFFKGGVVHESGHVHVARVLGCTHAEITMVADATEVVGQVSAHFSSAITPVTDIQRLLTCGAGLASERLFGLPKPDPETYSNDLKMFGDFMKDFPDCKTSFEDTVTASTWMIQKFIGRWKDLINLGMNKLTIAMVPGPGRHTYLSDKDITKKIWRYRLQKSPDEIYSQFLKETVGS